MGKHSIFVLHLKHDWRLYCNKRFCLCWTNLMPTWGGAVSWLNNLLLKSNINREIFWLKYPKQDTFLSWRRVWRFSGMGKGFCANSLSQCNSLSPSLFNNGQHLPISLLEFCISVFLYFTILIWFQFIIITTRLDTTKLNRTGYPLC